MIRIENWWLVNGANWWTLLHLEVSRFILPSSRITIKGDQPPSHSNTTIKQSQVLMLRRPLSSPSVVFCIPIANTAHTVLARACHRNLYTLKFLLGIAGNQIFGERFDAVLAPWATTSSTSWWRERLLHLFSGDRSWTTLRTISCINFVWLYRTKLVK